MNTHLNHHWIHTDGTEIRISGPQADKATALIQVAPDMLRFLENMHQRLDDQGKNNTTIFNDIGVLIARANGEG